ncbi:MAG: hypothetical protein Q9183_002957, partial [Haloplaca sp. 2 TL-2023]
QTLSTPPDPCLDARALHIFGILRYFIDTVENESKLLQTPLLSEMSRKNPFSLWGDILLLNFLFEHFDLLIRMDVDPARGYT